MEMFKHIFKEFWLPLAIAIGWTVYVSWGNSFELKNIISAFSPAFFLASWMTGQFFRIKKQESVQQGINSVETRVEKLLVELENKAKELVCYTTGGDAFCYFNIEMSGNSSTWTVVHQGQYPLYNVGAVVVDVEKINTTVAWGFPYVGNSHKIGDLGDGQTKKIFMLDFGKGNAKDFKVIFSARNGSFTQIISFRRVNGKWVKAIKVESMVSDSIQNPVLERVDADYPK